MGSADQRRAKLIEELKRVGPLPEDEDLPHEIMIKYRQIITDLQTIADESCIEPLVDSLGPGTANDLYWNVVTLLETLNSDRLHEVLLRTLKQGTDGQREWASIMLMRAQNPAHVPYLIDALVDPSPDVRENAATALQIIGDPVAIDALKKMTADPHQDVRESVAGAIAALEAKRRG